MIDLAKELVTQKLGDTIDGDTISNAVEGLFGEGFDISNILAQTTQNGGLTDIIHSWIGNGENMTIEPNSIMSILGEEKVANFASMLNLDTGNALSLLSNIVPTIINKTTSDEGGLLESVGGLDGAMKMASKFF